MIILNIEIKSRIKDPASIESLLEEKGARYIGMDHQVDTYFNVREGRLKLRQGQIENSLIRYHRPESTELKRSVVQLQKLPANSEGIKSILSELNGVWTIVDKKRKIFFIDNVKFHIDEVAGLGQFVEIEAIAREGEKSENELRDQCDYYIDYLQLDRKSFIDRSYSDMVSNVNGG